MHSVSIHDDFEEDDYDPPSYQRTRQEDIKRYMNENNQMEYEQDQKTRPATPTNQPYINNTASYSRPMTPHNDLNHITMSGVSSSMTSPVLQTTTYEPSVVDEFVTKADVVVSSMTNVKSTIASSTPTDPLSTPPSEQTNTLLHPVAKSNQTTSSSRSFLSGVSSMVVDTKNKDIELDIQPDEEFKHYIDLRAKKLHQRIQRDRIDQRSSDWTENKFDTLSSWMKIAAFYIKINDKCINRYKTLLKTNTIVSMILSTLSGTISVFNYNDNNYAFALNFLFTSCTFTMAVFSSYIKIDQVQEKLEEFIKLKQEWSAFSAALSAELVLPLNLRQSSVELINRYKGKFLDLIKTDLEYPSRYKQLIIEEGYSLSQIINTFVLHEDIRLKDRAFNDIPEEERSVWAQQIDHRRYLNEIEHRRLFIQHDDEFRSFHRENKKEIQHKYPNLRPREISDKLYEQYQQLLFGLRKDPLNYLKLYTYIEIANNERAIQEHLIDQEYHIVTNDPDQVCSCYILHHWYKEHILQPEKKPNQLTNLLHERFNTLSQDAKEYWNNKTTLLIALKPALIQKGPALLMYYINNNKRIMSYYKHMLQKEDIASLQKSIMEEYSLLEEEETSKLKEVFNQNYNNLCTDLHHETLYLEDVENFQRRLFHEIKSASVSCCLSTRVNGFVHVIDSVGTQVKSKREKVKMMRNPFYRVVKYEGFDLTMVFPSYDFKHPNVIPTKPLCRMK